MTDGTITEPTEMQWGAWPTVTQAMQAAVSAPPPGGPRTSPVTDDEPRVNLPVPRTPAQPKAPRRGFVGVVAGAVLVIVAVVAAVMVLAPKGGDSTKPIAAAAPTSSTGSSVKTASPDPGPTTPSTAPPTTLAPAPPAVPAVPAVPAAPAFVAPPAPPGFTAQGDPAAGFTVVLPSSFETVAVSGTDRDATMAAVGAMSPGHTSAMNFVRPLLDQGGAAFAVDRFFGSSVALVKLPASFPADPNQAAGALQQQLLANGATDLDLDQEVVPAGIAVELKAEFEYFVLGDDESVDQELYVVRGATATWLLVMSSADDADADDLFDVVLASLRVS